MKKESNKKKEKGKKRERIIRWRKVLNKINYTIIIKEEKKVI
jgi:hypothetical protein